MYRTI